MAEMSEIEKQPYEAFYVAVDFSSNFTDSETVISQTVSAVDKNGEDTTSVIDQGTVGNDGVSIVRARVIDGSPLLSKYKITFRCITSTGNKWEKDIKLVVKEL